MNNRQYDDKNIVLHPVIFNEEVDGRRLFQMYYVHLFAIGISESKSRIYFHTPGEGTIISSTWN